MVCQDLIDEGFLSLKGFESAAVWDSIIIQGWIDDLREQFGGGAEAMSGSPIPAIQRLAEHKLAAVGGILLVPSGWRAHRLANPRENSPNGGGRLRAIDIDRRCRRGIGCGARF